MFSATMPPEIKKLADSVLHNPAHIEIAPVASTTELVEQHVYHVKRDSKPALLAHLYEAEPMSRVLVFTRTKHGADRVARRLHSQGIHAEAIHGNKSQNARQRALSNLKAGKIAVLVATDVAARGIDVDDISHVVNYDIPHEPETYVHRIGRTGRAGAQGIAISFCDEHEERAWLRDIERLIKKKINVRTDAPVFKAEPKPERTHAPHMKHDVHPAERRKQTHQQSERPSHAKHRSQDGESHSRQSHSAQSHQGGHRSGHSTGGSHAAHPRASHPAKPVHHTGGGVKTTHTTAHATASKSAHAVKSSHPLAAHPNASHLKPAFGAKPSTHRKGRRSPGSFAKHVARGK
jgi:ATP-dependent RNA helicase RhlE